MQIHPTAIIAEGATIGEGTVVGPYSCIGANVKLGKDCKIASHVVLEGYTEIGDCNKIYQFASVGAQPQALQWNGEITKLIIGDNNIIREYATMQPGLEQFGGVTTVGSNNLFMACSHVAHDVTIGDNNWFTNSVAIAGHISIGSKVIFGGMSAAYQYCKIGDYAFISAGTIVAKDVPPYCIVQGEGAQLRSINKIGLERAGFSKEDIKKIYDSFKMLFVEDGTLSEGLKKVKDKYKDFTPAMNMVDFINKSERGLVSYE